MGQKLISICIPTYNRPNELKRLFDSIDTTKYDDVDIVISENCSPKQAETRAIVEEFKKNTKLDVHYYENERNLGYDKNIRTFVDRTTGKFAMYFSDDDIFMPGAMDEFVEFVRAHQEYGYFLRSYGSYHEDGSFVESRYYRDAKMFAAGKDAYIALFDKSVFLSGFTIRTEYMKPFITDKLDGSLLYQVYQCAEVVYRYPAINSPIIISAQIPDENIHYFGECKEEKEFYSGADMTANNNLNFLKWYIKVIDYIEEQHKDGAGAIVKNNLAKLSYSWLSWEIKKNGKGQNYKQYCKEIRKMGLSNTHFWIYKIAIDVFGVKICDWGVQTLKKIIGHRPNL